MVLGSRKRWNLNRSHPRYQPNARGDDRKSRLYSGNITNTNEADLCGRLLYSPEKGLSTLSVKRPDAAHRPAARMDNPFSVRYSCVRFQCGMYYRMAHRLNYTCPPANFPIHDRIPLRHHGVK